MGIFIIKPDGSTDSMTTVSVKDENKELQTILERTTTCCPVNKSIQMTPADGC